MKLKYYLRGIGVGMFVTAVILHFTFKNAYAGSMTDEQIKARARELGMIESTVLSNISENNVDEDDENTGASELVIGSVSQSGITGESVSDNETISGNEVADLPDDNEEGDTPDNTEVTSNTEQTTPEDTTTGTPGESVNYVTINVVSGDSSYTVAKKVYEAGLITSIALFDEYLCTNNYDKILHVGQFRIPVDATDEEIAKLLTTG